MGRITSGATHPAFVSFLTVVGGTDEIVAAVAGLDRAAAMVRGLTERADEIRGDIERTVARLVAPHRARVAS